MIKFGCCINMSAEGDDTLGMRKLEALAANGFDYAEFPLAQVMDLSDAEFLAVLKRLRSSGIVCEACNNFFPARIKLTGPASSMSAVEEYGRNAVSRANELGAKVIVFGSSGARNVEDGFDMGEAKGQLKDALETLSGIAAPYGINIAIESLNRRESNIINSLSEGADLAALTARPNVGVLIDLYHMEMENEPLEVIQKLRGEGARFMHAHIADTPTGRGFPLDKTRFLAFAAALKAVAYGARLSVEGYTKDFSKEIKTAKETLDSLFRS